MSRAGRLAIMLGLLALVLLAFGPGLFGGFVWDDHSLLTNNGALRSSSGLWGALGADFWAVSTGGARSGYYRPVVVLAYYLQLNLFGLAPLGYHVVSLVLHLLCVALALDWLLARSAFDTSSRSGYGACVLGALLFALHPTRTEAVSWISGCTDLWLTLFALLALRCARAEHAAVRLGLACLCAAAALLAKESALVLPVLVLLDALLRTAGPARRRALQVGLALLATHTVVLAVRAAFVPLPLRPAGEVLRQLGPRVLSSLGHYTQPTLLPLSPTVLRGKLAMDDHGVLLYEPGSVLLGALCAAGYLLLGLLAVRRAALRPWFADASWFVLGLLPVLNIVPLNLPAQVADRYLYLPLLGVCALLVRAVAPLLASPRAALRWLPWLLAAGCVVSFSATIREQGRALASDVSLWEHELHLDPARPYVLERTTLFALQSGDLARAQRLASAGLALCRVTHHNGPALRFALLAAKAAVASTPDLDQARLLKLRAFYDALATHGEGQLDLPATRAGSPPHTRPLALALRLSLRLAPPERGLLHAEVAHFHLVRAELYARTAALSQAQAQLLALLALDRAQPAVLAQLAVVRALQRDLPSAQALVAEAQRLAPALPLLSGVARALAQARELSRRPADSALGVVLREAQLDLVLGGRVAARERLDRALLAYPGAPPAIVLRAQVDALDGLPELALARIDAARTADPEHAATYARALAELQQLTRGAR